MLKGVGHPLLALRLHCSGRNKKAAEVIAVARPGPRGLPKSLH
jgi:hypothetical protein